MVPGIKPIREALDVNRAEWERLEEEYVPKEELASAEEISKSSSSSGSENDSEREEEGSSARGEDSMTQI